MTLNAKSMYIVNEDIGEALQIFVESCSNPEFFGGWE